MADNKEARVIDWDVQRHLAASLPVIVVQHSSQRIVWSNQRVESLFGCNVSLGLHLHGFDHLMPERFRAGHDMFWNSFWENPQTRLMSNIRIPCRRFDASEFDAVLLLMPVAFGGEMCCTVAFLPLDDSPSKR